MSAPIQRDDSSDDERFYAPPWARGEPLETHARAPSGHSPPVAPGPVASTIDRAPPAARLSSFEGDRAVGQLRRRLTLEPEIAPEPPIELRRQRMIPWPLRFVLVLVAAAAAAYGVAPRFTGNEPAPTVTPGDSPTGNQKWTLASVGSVPQPAPQARLVVEARQAFEDEPLAMGISLRGAAGSQVVVLTGLAEGTRLTSGVPVGPTSWRLAAVDLDKVLATPPDGFVGVMDLAVDLRSPSDALVDSQVARLEWVAKPGVMPAASEAKLDRADRAQSPGQEPGRDEIATLVRRGFEFMKSGDLVAARLVLQRAANAGHAEAALTLGASYDPGVLAGLGVVGFAADVAQARTWYQKAQELGSAEALRRIEQLALAEKR